MTAPNPPNARYPTALMRYAALTHPTGVTQLIWWNRKSWLLRSIKIFGDFPNALF
jgi:hypothetical protein